MQNKSAVKFLSIVLLVCSNAFSNHQNVAESLFNLNKPLIESQTKKEIDAITVELSATICNASHANEAPTTSVENQLRQTEQQLSNVLYSTIFCSILLGAWLFEQIRSSMHNPCCHHHYLEKF